MNVVITGASCSGKTTIIKALSNLGYDTIHESARRIISEFPNLDYYSRQLLIIDDQLGKDLSDELVFLDRGVIDSLVYTQYFGYELPGALMNRINEAHYDLVFYLEPLSIYYPDSVRFEGEATSRHVGELIRCEYLKRDYCVISVPEFTPEKPENVKKRLDCVLEKTL